MFLQNRLRLLEGSTNWNGHQRLLGHHFGYRNFEARFKSQVAVSNNTDEVTILIHHRNTADVKSLHHQQRFAHWFTRQNRYRVDDHSRFRSLNLVNFFSLAFDAQIFVNDSDAALLGERDGQRRFSHGVHRRRAKRNLKTYVAREASRRVGLVWQNVRASRHQKYVIKSKTLGHIC